MTYRFSGGDDWGGGGVEVWWRVKGEGLIEGIPAGCATDRSDSSGLQFSVVRVVPVLEFSAQAGVTCNLGLSGPENNSSVLMEANSMQVYSSACVPSTMGGTN